MKIVFDFGGVLLRWRPHEFLKLWLPEHTQTLQATQDLLEKFFQGFGGDWGEFDRGTLAEAPLAERIAARTGLSVHQTRRVIDAVPQELQPLPASVAVLRRLHASGHELFFLSNMPEPYARRLEATHDFLRCFRQGIFSARVRMIKPEPAIFAHATAMFGLSDEPALFIDDVARNITAARLAGWQAIHFQDAQQCARELTVRGLVPIGAA